MITNNIVSKGSLPVDSDDRHIKKTSLKLYIYLLYISRVDYSSKYHLRQFQQKDFTINKISKATQLDPKTIKKYWQILEREGMIRYEGVMSIKDERECNQSWEKTLQIRRRYKESYYTIIKPEKFRRIPKETIEKLIDTLSVSELELKIYILLANLQESYYYNKIDTCYVGCGDLLQMLDMSNQRKNRVEIIKSMYWLQEIGLIDFKIEQKKNNNFNQMINVFSILQVNYYTDGGCLKDCCEIEQDLIVPEKIKKETLERIKMGVE